MPLPALDLLEQAHLGEPKNPASRPCLQKLQRCVRATLTGDNLGTAWARGKHGWCARHRLDAVPLLDCSACHDGVNATLTSSNRSGPKQQAGRQIGATSRETETHPVHLPKAKSLSSDRGPSRVFILDEEVFILDAEDVACAAHEACVAMHQTSVSSMPAAARAFGRRRKSSL